MRHGGAILIEALKAHGVERVFSVPGESFLAALDGLHDSGIANVVCRHEGAAAMMADAAGKLTGRPGVLFVTRGPGATNAASGLHVARQDSTPLVCFVGQIARGHRDREAFQELDYRAVFGNVVKWAAEVDDTARLPEYVNRAFHVAQSGRPGPVVLALPEDMLSAMAEVAPIAPTAPARPAYPDMAQGRDALAAAKRPLIVVGGPHWSQAAADALTDWAESSGIPVAVSFRRQDRINNTRACYAGDLSVGGNPALFQRLAEADVILALGTRLGDIATGSYSALDPARPVARLIHVHPDADEIGRVHRADLALVARADDAALALAATDPVQGQGMDDAHAAYHAWQDPVASPGDVRQERVIAWLADNLPDDAILTNGAGNYAAWLHRYYRWRRVGTQLAPTSGSMGYGFPAAIAASVIHPERTVVCLAGDGCFQMTLNEMSTARQHGATPIVIVANNGRYGTIRAHQEKHYPGRVSGTDLANPDFAALAQAYGGHGAVITDDADFPDAFRAAAASGLPAVIELRLHPDTLSPTKSLRAAMQRKA